MAFAYSLLLKLLYPTSIALILMAAGLVVRSPRARRTCQASALAVLLICGNGWVVAAMVRGLEGRHPSPDPVPTGDAILVLSGGVFGRTPPRPSVELGDAGDRVVYGASLFKRGKAPRIICTGNVATGGVAPRPAAEDMAELLGILGIATDAVVTETRSENTHDHARLVCPMLRERGMSRVLLVTSAMHMPRAMGVFRRFCPDVEMVATPTDFRAPDDPRLPWYRQASRVLPTPRSLLDFSEAAHEYVGIAYYTARGWM